MVDRTAGLVAQLILSDLGGCRALDEEIDRLQSHAANTAQRGLPVFQDRIGALNGLAAGRHHPGIGRVHRRHVSAVAPGHRRRYLGVGRFDGRAHRPGMRELGCTREKNNEQRAAKTN